MDMKSIINRVTVFKLNKAWQVVGQSTIGKAIVDLAGGLSAKAIDFEYELDADGNPFGDAISMNPVEWEQWLELPVRPWEMDDAIHYGNGNKIMRAPTVLIAKNFNKMPVKKFKGKPSKDAIWIRDEGIDQYTGEYLRRDEATIDHVLPQSKGGRDTWENLVVTHRDVNSKKGNRLNHEAGLTLIRPAKTPAPVPISLLIRDVKHPDWKPFLVKVDKK